MSNPLQQTIEALAKEKGVEQDIIIAALQDAIEAAAVPHRLDRRLGHAVAPGLRLMGVPFEPAVMGACGDQDCKLAYPSAEPGFEAQIAVERRFEIGRAHV